jgi:hypothetical protein
MKYRHTSSLILHRNKPCEAEVCIRHACGSCFEHFAIIDELAKHTTSVHIDRASWPLFQSRPPALIDLPGIEPVDPIVVEQSDYDDNEYHSKASFASPPVHSTDSDSASDEEGKANVSSMIEDVIVRMKELLSKL